MHVLVTQQPASLAGGAPGRPATKLSGRALAWRGHSSCSHAPGPCRDRVHACAMPLSAQSCRTPRMRCAAAPGGPLDAAASPPLSARATPSNSTAAASPPAALNQQQLLHLGAAFTHAWFGGIACGPAAVQERLMQVRCIGRSCGQAVLAAHEQQQVPGQCWCDDAQPL